jgi:hypothetical protein
MWKVKIKHSDCPYRFDAKPAICDKTKEPDVKCRKKNCPLINH